MHRIVAIGPHSWRAHEMSALDRAFEKLAVPRYFSTGCCPAGALLGATWVLLAIDDEQGAHERNLLKQIDTAQRRISLGILCIGSVEAMLLRHYRRLDDGGIRLVVVRSPRDHSRVPIFPGHHSMVAEDLVASAPDIARAMVGR